MVNRIEEGSEVEQIDEGRRSFLGGALTLGVAAATVGVLGGTEVAEAQSLRTSFSSEQEAVDYAHRMGRRLVKDIHHRYGFVSPGLAERQLLGRPNMRVANNGMIVLYRGFQGWRFTGQGDVTRIQIQEQERGGGDGGNNGGGDDDGPDEEF